MSQNELKNLHSLIYYTSKLSSSWTLTNPYSFALRGLLLDHMPAIDELRTQQEYHYLAKIIYDAVSGKKAEVKKNIDELHILMDSYDVNRNQKNGDVIIDRVFTITILNFLSKSIHLGMINSQKISKFLLNYNSSDRTLMKKHGILSLIYSIQNQSWDEKYSDNLELALVLLYNRLLIYNSSTRTKEKIIDYYIKQMKLEEIDVENITSEISMIKILEISVILKATTGNGLYIPELEKEQYLSNISKELVVEKYLKILNDSFTYNLINMRLPSWTGYIFFFTLQSILFLAPTVFDGIQLGPIGIDPKIVTSIPIWVLLFLNGIALALYNMYCKKKLENKTRDLEWR